MSGFEAKIIQQIVQKLGIQDNPNLIAKSTELMRLLELKSSSSQFISSISIYGKTVLCIDLVAEQLGILIEMDHLIKISGLKQSLYKNYKKNIMKVLDLEKPLDIKDICTQLNINEVTKKSIELYDLFKEQNMNENIEVTHPQYKAMAIYQACKLLKKKLPKSTILKFSNLKPAQWSKLEEKWDKLITTEVISKSNQDKKNTKNENNTENLECKHNEENLKRKTEEIEDYEIWKRRMIIFAQIQLGYINIELYNDDDV